MSKRSSRSGPGVSDVLDVHLTEFLATLAKAGYADKTRHDDGRLILPFIRGTRFTFPVLHFKAASQKFATHPSLCLLSYDTPGFSWSWRS